MKAARRRWLRWALAAAGVAAVAALAVGGNVLSRYRGWTVERLEPDALSALLAPAYRVMKPDGTGPFPTALLFSGCDGPRDNVLRWAERLNREGWAAVVVDSHGPRGLVDHEVWRLVCAGQVLLGSERAGDVLIAIDDVRRMPFADKGRIALVGASHGGWAIMDLLAMDPPERLPYNLARLRADAPADPLAGVVGAILLYPYCGEASLARPDGLAAGAAGPLRPQPRRLRGAVGPVRRDRRRAEGPRPAGGDGGARGRDARVRPGGAVGVQPARVRPGGDGAGAGGRDGVPGGGGRQVAAHVLRGPTRGIGALSAVRPLRGLRSRKPAICALAPLRPGGPRATPRHCLDRRECGLPPGLAGRRFTRD